MPLTKWAVAALDWLAPGLSGRSAISALRTAGETFTDAAFWTLWRGSKIADMQSYFRALEVSERPDAARFIASRAFQPGIYEHRVKVEWYDPDIAGWTEGVRSVFSDSRLSGWEAFLQSVDEAKGTDPEAALTMDYIGMDAGFIYKGA